MTSQTLLARAVKIYAEDPSVSLTFLNLALDLDRLERSI